MKIAVITGASSGMGREAAIQIARTYNEFDEIWLIARRQERLERMKEVLFHHFGVKVQIFSYDLQQEEWKTQFLQALQSQKPEIGLLFHSAGYGRNGIFTEDTLENQIGMVRLNCEALTAMVHLCLPYMPKKSRVILVASSAAFAPQPAFAVYAASKAYVLSFARALKLELQERGITVTAVCPGPVDTEFFARFDNKHSVSELKKKVMAKPSEVVRLALRDSEKGKAESIYGNSMKVTKIACKLFPWWLIAGIMKQVNHVKENEAE